MKTKCNVKRCRAACCGLVPIPARLLHECSNMMQRQIAMQVEVEDDNIIAVDDNFRCVFLTPDYRCAIYDQRPQICRDFGSDAHPLLKCEYLARDAK